MTWLRRQSFLGVESDHTLGQATVGLIGLGGGGSHIAQQLAHVGIGSFLLIDPDRIEHHNLNRLVGGTLRFVRRKMFKTDIAKRVIRGVQPGARVKTVRKAWQFALDDIRMCDVVMGSLDSFSERDELERFCRQNLVPYVDIGMDVTEAGPDFLVGGQVLLSIPGEPCLRCVGVVTDERIQREAEQYGAAGPRPQVVWPNGVLASLAVGYLIQLLTPWHKSPSRGAFREYDANSNIVRESPKWRSCIERACPHHPPNDRGDPAFDIRDWLNQTASPPNTAFGRLGMFVQLLWARRTAD